MNKKASDIHKPRVFGEHDSAHQATPKRDAARSNRARRAKKSQKHYVFGTFSFCYLLLHFYCRKGIISIVHMHNEFDYAIKKELKKSY